MTQRASSYRVFSALFAGIAVYGFAMGTTYPVLGLMLADRVSDFWNGVSVAAAGAGLICGVFATRFLVSSLGAGGTACLGVVVMAGALLTISEDGSYWVLLVQRFALGLGANFMFIVTEIGLNTMSSSHERGRLLGLYTMITAVGFVVGPGLVGLLPGVFDPLLLGCGIVCAAALLPFLSVRRRLDARIEAPAAQGLLPVLRACPAAFVFIVLASAVDAVVLGLLPVIGLRSGFDAAQGAWLVAVFHIGLLLAQPAIGWALDIGGRRVTVLACLALNFVCCLYLVVLGPGAFTSVLAVFFLWGGVNYGLYTAGLTLLGDRFRGAALSAATATFALVYALSYTLAPGFAAFAMSSGSPASLYVTMALAYFAVLAWALIRFRPGEPQFSPA